MRWLVLLAILLLIQLLSYGLAHAIFWLIAPKTTQKSLKKYLLIGCFLVSNALIVLGFLGYFRLLTGYLALLWLGLLSACISMVLITLINRTTKHPHPIAKRLLALSVFVGFIALSVYNAYMPVVRHATITLDKPMPTPVRLAIASDLHLGKLVGKRQLDKLTQLLTQHKVDLLLMPGDIMGDDTVVFDQENMQHHFAQALNAPHFGTVATLGNHDLYRTHAYNDIIRAIYDTQAILLNDQTTTLTITKNNQSTKLQFIGRLDDHAQRLPTEALMTHIDHTLPVILLDHRPSEIDVNVKLPIDIQVSGHTHKGQIFPANWIVLAINRVGYGHKKIHNTHVIVSSGFGFWGVPFRFGSQAEIWVVDVQGQNQAITP